MNKLKELVLMANQDIDDGNDADYPPYLCFQALESDFRVRLGGDFHEHVCQYSFNRKDWFDLPARTYTPAIGILQKVYFRANLTPVAMDASDPNGVMSIGIFSTTKKCRLSGNPTSMLHGDGCLTDKSVTSYGLTNLLEYVKCVSVSYNFFEFDKVNFRSCYRLFGASFDGKNYYLTGDIIIHKSGADGTYSESFQYQPVNTISINGSTTGTGEFSSAFEGTKIKKITLPATYIAYGAYRNVCRNCSKLEEAFINGRSLGVGDDIKINHLNGAFYGCSSLSKVTYLVTTPFAKKYTNNWLTGVAEDGEIILNKFVPYDPEIFKNGSIDNIEGSATLGDPITWGIPANWTVKYCDPTTLEVTENRDELIEDGRFIKLSYIKTNGSQRLDSGITLDSDYRVEIDAQLGNGSLKWMLFGNIENDNAFELNGANTGNTANRTTRFGNAECTSNLYRAARTKYAVDKTGIYIYDEQSVEWKKIGSWDATPNNFTHANSFYILSERNGDSVQYSARQETCLYGLKVYRNDNLIADMVPRISLSHGRPGLYDKINDRFLINIGTGEFTYQ